ncbi:uncharacterized protein BXZ73DRAFT_97031 [Epithele typhae]|uniref:uncharacterized protein n=1 Tax=Epithele typhae TaxID=378194 RepID=UPI002008610A|nr:uncharacterized protein BXZ73DRAFT_97031 [Epithele typhae]KAH9944548.1 hypothetical protein BXZ73DRAFT_97031 [Epithele typhae]
MADADLATVWHLLEITGIIQSVLCALFGVYTLLFVLALWANHGRRGVASRRLRAVTIALYVNLCAHFVARSLQFDRARIMNPPDNEFFKWGIPLIVIGKRVLYFDTDPRALTAGLCSDGLLAWRFYTIFDRKKWGLYIPMTFVVINALLCWSSDAQHLAAYYHYELYEDVLLPVTLQITMAWGWLMFAINTILTTAIVVKIFYIARMSRQMKLYKTVLLACVESAIVTWVGLLLYEICSLAPNGHIVVSLRPDRRSLPPPQRLSDTPVVSAQTNYDVGYVMASVIPDFFGISQCLIVVRVALSNEFSARAPPSSRTISFVVPSQLFSTTQNKCDGSTAYAETEAEACPEQHTLQPVTRSETDYGPV